MRSSLHIFFLCFVDESNKYMKYYQKMDKYFVETKTYKMAKKVFKTYGIVILTGPPGSGKTLTAVHLIGKRLHYCTFRKIHSWKELSYIDEDEKSLVLIDNLFSNNTLYVNLKKWWDELDNLYENYFAGKENEIRSERLRIIITARSNVIERACALMEKVTPCLNKRHIIDASTYTEDEKDDILRRQIEFANVEHDFQIPKMDDVFKQEVKKSEGPIGFPLCAHLYVCFQKYQKSGADFFSRPTEFLKLQIKDEIESDKTHRVKSLFFVFLFHEWQRKMGNYDSFQIQNETLCKECLNKVNPNLLSHFGPLNFNALESEAERLSGVFFKRIDETTYQFVHDSVYEAVRAYLCKMYATESEKYFPLDIIQHQFCETVQEREMSIIALRLLSETLDEHFSDVFSSKLFQNRHFAYCFCEELKKEDQKTINRIFTVPNKSSNVKLPCLFWSSVNNHAYLTELLYDISTIRGINPKYQLYVLLYGVCCARFIGLINEWHYANFEMIKKRVMEFIDHEGNTILHHLIKTPFSDEFSSFAVENLLKDGMQVSLKNNSRNTPLMFAVEQILPRKKVVKSMVKFSKHRLHFRDVHGSSILHHCLDSNNTDKACTEYLKIILEDDAIDRMLEKDDVNGNTPLSIAANCAKHSRIQSILTLLESNANIVNTLNEDGCSPLHLAVECFKDTETSFMVELECCCRVVILILFGASTENESDDKHKAVDNCKYDLVKSILRNPKDKKNMESKLETLLEKLNWKGMNEITEKEFIHSEKISEGIGKCITNAVHHLENIRLDHQ